MTSERIILTDADGVLVSWGDTFDKFLAGRGYLLLPDTEHYYNLAVRYVRSDGTFANHKEMADLVTEFNNSKHIKTLPAYKDSEKFIPLLVEQGFRFICVTSLSDHPDAKKHRKHNLESLFGDIFDDLVCLETGASKQHVLTRWADTGYFWIEDHFKNAEAGYEVGLKSIIVDTPYNRHYHTDLFPRVNMEHPWEDIYQHIMNEYGEL